MGMSMIPDAAEVRGQIGRLRDDIANWRSLIEAAEAKIAQFDTDLTAAGQPPEDDRTGS